MLKNILTTLCLLPLFSIAIAQNSGNSNTEQTTEKSAVPTTNGKVSRAQFTSAIQEREPSDTLSEADTSTQRIYFFTELSNFEGQTLTHRWTFLGEKMAEVNFNVGGNRWRVWSSKQMMPHWLGNWTVEVVAADGNVLSSQTLNYIAAPEKSEATVTQTESAPNSEQSQ